MHFSALALLSLATASMAVPPAAPVPASVEERATTLGEFWGDKDYLGLKYTAYGDYGYCYNFPSDFRNYITSAKSRPGYRCTVYVETGCKGTGFTFISSSKFPDWIDNKSKSWYCAVY